MIDPIISRVIQRFLHSGQNEVSPFSKFLQVSERKQPYLHGEWRRATSHLRGGYSWESEDPDLGRVVLTVGTLVKYKMRGSLKNPEGTQTIWTIYLGTPTDPFAFKWDEYSAKGEGSARRSKYEKVSDLLTRIFGVAVPLSK